MKTIDITTEETETVFMIISHKFKGLKNIIVSGKKIYQLPCNIGKKSFRIKEMVQNKGFYLIESRRYSIKQLKELIYRRKDKYLLDTIYLYPF